MPAPSHFTQNTALLHASQHVALLLACSSGQSSQPFCLFYQSSSLSVNHFALRPQCMHLLLHIFIFIPLLSVTLSPPSNPSSTLDLLQMRAKRLYEAMGFDTAAEMKTKWDNYRKRMTRTAARTATPTASVAGGPTPAQSAARPRMGRSSCAQQVCI